MDTGTIAMMATLGSPNTADAISDLRRGLYALAADLMRAPADDRSAEGILGVTDQTVVTALAAEHGYFTSGWSTEGSTALAYVLRYLMRALGMTDLDLALDARRLADAL